MDEFREDNTEGYTKKALDRFNAEWEREVAVLEIEADSSEYNTYLKRFADNIARR